MDVSWFLMLSEKEGSAMLSGYLLELSENKEKQHWLSFH